MRVPGIHVLLTAGVVTVTLIGTVIAFTLTGTGSAEPRLDPVAPPPAVAAPVGPAPLPAPPAPAPAPVVEDKPAAEPTTEPDDSDDTRDTGGSAGRQHAPKAEPTRKPQPPSADTPEQRKVRWACQNGFIDEKYCSRYN